MSPQPPSDVPAALSAARRQLEQWRRRQSGRPRLPRELWAQAVALAREHGINKTARLLGLKYESLKKHLEATPPGASSPGTAGPEFLELLPRMRVPSSLDCTIELEDNRGWKLRMQVKGVGIADLASFARGWRDGQA